MGAATLGRIKVLIAILICSCTGFSQTRQSPSRPSQTRAGAPFLQYVRAYEETPYVTKVILKNGMTVLVDEYRGNPVVTMQVYVHAGYTDDPPQSPGIASLVAAMVLRGAADKSGGSYRQQVQALGGIATGSADYASTLLELVVPSNQWKRALTAQADGILNPSFNREDARREAMLLQNESSGILKNPEMSGNEKLLELAFRPKRIGKFDLLRRADLANISAEAMAAFHKAHYAPAKMLLVVSGDANSSEVLNEVVRLYSKSAGAAVKPAVPAMADAQSDFRFSSARANVSIPHLFLGFRAGAENGDDFKALQVLGAILGMGEGSALSSQIRDQKKLILEQETKVISYPEFGYLSIHAKVKPGDIDRGEIAILTEIELLKREEPTEAEMERALAMLERSYWKELETVSGRASALAHFEYMGDWKRMERRIPEWRKVKPGEVKRVAGKYLRLENCTLVEYLPVGGEERLLTEEAARQTLAALIPPSTDQEQAERERQTVLGVKIPPRPGNFKYNEIRYPFQTASILRGPDLFIREDHTNPVIEMGLFFPGGRLDEKKENSGITALMTQAMLRGQPTFRQFYRQLEVYGGVVEPVVRDDYFGFYLSVLSANFEAAFRLLLESVRAPAFDKEEVARQKELLLADDAERRHASVYALELLNQALFEDFPYGNPCAGTEASIASMTPESLRLWYEGHVRNRKPVAALIGDTKGTSLASVFVQNFSGSRMQEAKLPEDFAKAREKEKLIDQGWSGGESLILVGFQAPPEDDEDGYAAAALEGYSGNPGRLSQELRDRLGIAHQLAVAYEPRLRGGSLIIYLTTGPQNEEEALQALRDELQRVRKGPIPFRDFRSALNEAAGTYVIRQQIRAVQIADIVENVIAGKGLQGFQDYASGLQEVTEEDLQSVARRIFSLDRAVTVVLRGTK